MGQPRAVPPRRRLRGGPHQARDDRLRLRDSEHAGLLGSDHRADRGGVTMRAAIFNGPRDITVADVSDPSISAPTDAVVRVVLACVCGSDLWFWRGQTAHDHDGTGHEFIGVVEAVGSAVTAVREGDFVIAPFAFSDGTCPNCLAGIQTACVNGGFFGGNGVDGAQAERVRVPQANGTLVKVPAGTYDHATMRSLLTLSDVMGTGHHAAVSAGVTPGDTVAVVGDGAVGLSAVLAAKRLGAGRIIGLSRKPSRQAVAREFGASSTGRPTVATKVRPFKPGYDATTCTTAHTTRIAWGEANP